MIDFMKRMCDDVIRQHQERVENWIRTAVIKAGMDPTDLNTIKSRCSLRQYPGYVELYIDNVCVSILDDAS